MGLAGAIQKATQAAFLALGDIPKEVSYVSVSEPVYNATTGSSTSAEVSYTVDMVLSSFDQDELDNQAILPIDLKGLVPSLNLDVTPSTRDYITYSSEQWNVVGIMTDPADALWKLQLRRS